ncbi:hypothetical protein [Nostoc sp. ChiQUE01b]|uniref:hypothetical protein n=1 Tax=Nostoc sp. ChiQUE01b TaxID=3075376 RepID=UPI002AD3FC49|nr:hypothetical protein [Nostoc sp. ChiQUE01b]MDZ8260328.1 hypothetical protein [Nostoc sp. ChiQUE01b]
MMVLSRRSLWENLLGKAGRSLIPFLYEATPNASFFQRKGTRRLAQRYTAVF